MALDWIKIAHNLENKPEVIGIARRVRQHRLYVVGLLVRFWSWIDQISTDGNNLSLTYEDVDETVGLPGFAAALKAEHWLDGREGSLQLPNFERHNGSSAKARALETEAKRLRRLSDNLSDNMSDICPTKPAGIVRPDERRARGETTRSKSDRITIGSSNGKNGANHPPPPRSDRPPIKKVPEEDGPTLDLSGVDWDHVSTMAETVSRKIKPKSEDDRRAWLKFAVLANMTFGENWLMDAAEAVLRAPKSRKSQQSHFVAVLKSKAKTNGVDEGTFLSMLRRIEIPNQVWHSEIARVNGS